MSFSFVELLNELKNVSNYSYEKLALRVGIDAELLRAIIENKVDMSQECMKSLAKFFGQPPGEFLEYQQFLTISHLFIEPQLAQRLTPTRTTRVAEFLKIIKN